MQAVPRGTNGMIIKLAWRNLWRNKRRTLITVLSVAFGVWLSVTFTGVGGYIYTQIIDTGVSMGLGHVTIQAKGYQDLPSLTKRVGSVTDLRRLAMGQKGVLAASPRIQGSAMFSTATRSVGGYFVGLEPTLESAQTSQLLKALREGQIFESGSSKGAVIGWRMAEKLKLKVGKKMVCTFSNVNGEVGSMLTRVSGIFKTGSEEADGSVVLLPISAAAATLGYGPDEAGAVAIFLKDQRQAEGTVRALKLSAGNPENEILSWQETQTELAGIVRMDKTFNYFFQLILGLMISIGILNTVLMSVLERKREFGVMMALGLSPSVLFRLVLFESFFLGLAGLACGALISLPWYIYLDTHGLDLRSFFPQGIEAGAIMIELIYHIRLYPIHAAVISGVLMALTLLAGLYPAWKAGRVPPVESIKEL